jgi:hypothetical protein
VRISLPNDFEPLPHQTKYMRYFDQGGLRAYWVCHRRGGKDLTAGHQLCKMAHQRIGLYWHMLPSLRQARKVCWQGFRSDSKRYIDNVYPPALVASRNEADMRLELKCGSVVQFVGSDNYDSLVGSNPVGCVFSEFALTHPSAWPYVRPILLANGGWASFVTTPRGLGHAHDLWKVAKADPKWFAQLDTIYDTAMLPAAALEEERRNGMPEAMLRQEYLCDWLAANVGSVWGDLLEQLEKRGGLESWPAEEDEVFTSWDLGMADSTAIWMFRIGARGIEFVDHLEAHGKPLSYYADELERRPFKYVKHWLPHDARAKHLSTGTSVLEQLQARFGYGKVAIGPRMSLLDGVQAGRWLLQQDTRFHPRCEKGLEALRAYAYEYDEEKKVYSDKPAHNWASHTADAFRYASVVARISGIFKPPKLVTAEPVELSRSMHHQFTLDQLWDARGKRPRERRV